MNIDRTPHQAEQVGPPPGKPSIYLAGPSVFRPDALAWGKALCALCAAFGCTGLYPLDHQAPRALTGVDRAVWIYQSNLRLIQQADVVMADLRFFRGAEVDSGTAFEVGYAAALGKPVYGYLMGEGSLRERMRQQVPEHVDADHPGQDPQGWEIEELGFPLNLMLACASRLVVGEEWDCLQRIVTEWPVAGSR